MLASRYSWPIALLLFAAPARADGEKEACADAYEKGQRDQRGGHLQSARTQYLVCAREPCPAFMRADCTKWLAAIDNAMPTVTFIVKLCSSDAPEDCQDVAAPELTVDGQPVDARPGLAVPIDPGRHTVQAKTGGFRGTTEEIVAHEGERRIVGLNVYSAPPKPRPIVMAPPPPPPAERKRSTLPWIFGGVAAVGLASFGTFAILGRTEQSSDLDDCRGHCTHDDVSAVRTKYIIADVSLGISVVALGAAAYFFFASRGDAR